MLERLRRAAALGGCMAAWTIACAPAAEQGPAVEVLDSAGIRTVVHHEPAPLRTTLEGDAALTVPTEGSGDPVLYGVEGGVFTPGGGFAVANAGNHEILHFDPVGRVRARVGGEGEGPGEFRALAWIEAGADGHLFAFDSRNRTITAYDAEGGLLWSRPFRPAPDERELPPDAITASGTAVSVLADGSPIGYPRAFAFPSGSAGPLPLQGDFAVYPADSLTVAQPVPLGRRTLILWWEDPGQERFPLANVLGLPRMWWGGHTGRFAITSSLEPRIDVFDEGRLALIIREERALGAFQPDSVPERYAFAADSLPAYQDLRVDAMHRIWARLTEGEEEGVWRVFRANGLPLADVELPADARVLDADATRALLLRRDALDVESLEVRDLTLDPR